VMSLVFDWSDARYPVCTQTFKPSYNVFNPSAPSQPAKLLMLMQSPLYRASCHNSSIRMLCMQQSVQSSQRRKKITLFAQPVKPKRKRNILSYCLSPAPSSDAVQPSARAMPRCFPPRLKTSAGDHTSKLSNEPLSGTILHLSLPVCRRQWQLGSESCIGSCGAD